MEYRRIIPNSISGTNLILGVLSIFESVAGNFEWAAIYIILAVAVDACKIKALLAAGAAKFVNGILRSAVRGREAGTLLFPDKSADAALNLALTKLHPLWLVKHWLKQFGEEETEKLLDYNNLPPVLSLRTNTLKTTRSNLLEVLQAAGFEAVPSKWCEEGIICTKTAGLNALMEKAPDAFYMQDESSMLVAHAACSQPGMTVLDLCAAPGGKTTHLAQLMQNKGRIYACDIHPHKMELIKENAVRLGIDIIEPVLMDASVFKPEWADAADCVLVDAPCSGFGVLRRRAEARWRKNKKDLKVFPPLQKAILQNAARYVKPGGRLVYSTCTLEQAENNLLVSEFLNANTEFEYAGFEHPLTGEAINELQLLPQRDNVDGFYICVMRRKEL